MSYFSFEIDLKVYHLHFNTKKKKKQQNRILFFPCANEEAQRCQQSLQFSTAKNYRTAIRSLKCFANDADLSYAKITSDRIAAYVQWLKNKGIGMNTVSCYLRSLRAIYDKVSNHYNVEDNNPFKDIFTGRVKTVKRSVTDSEITCLRNLKIQQRCISVTLITDDLPKPTTKYWKE